jgi:hypothetical protein
MPLRMQPETDENLICVLNVFDEKQREKHRTLINEILSAKQETIELPNGYQVDFPYDRSLFLKIAEWISLEHLCCPFFSFKLQLETGILRLLITGNDQVKLFLRAWLAE